MMCVLASSIARLPSWSDLPWWGWVLVFGGLLVMIVLGSWTGGVAMRKGRNMQAWFLVGFFLPVIGLIIIYSVKPGEKQKAKPKS